MMKSTPGGGGKGMRACYTENIIFLKCMINATLSLQSLLFSVNPQLHLIGCGILHLPILVLSLYYLINCKNEALT